MFSYSTLMSFPYNRRFLTVTLLAIGSVSVSGDVALPNNR